MPFRRARAIGHTPLPARRTTSPNTIAEHTRRENLPCRIDMEDSQPLLHHSTCTTPSSISRALRRSIRQLSPPLTPHSSHQLQGGEENREKNADRDDGYQINRAQHTCTTPCRILHSGHLFYSVASTFSATAGDGRCAQRPQKKHGHGVRVGGRGGGDVRMYLR